MTHFRTTSLVIATLLAACSGQPEETTTTVEPLARDDRTETTAAEKTAAAPAAYPDGIHGIVAETMDSGGYTYVQVDTGSEKVWAAIPQASVAVGDDVKLQAGMPMQNYTSKTLGRTFEVVYFSGGLASTDPTAAVGLPAGHAPVTGSSRSPDGVGVDLTGITKVEGGQTVAEVFAGADSLVGNEVAIRGKVVKFNGGIMGTNFMHVRDGTGGQGANDLTVTSGTAVAVGDTVVVRGVLVADKDFGFGYEYDLIVEDAAVTVE